MDAVKRKEVMNELTAQGYSWSYVDSWQAKVTLWRHRPSKNTYGDVVSEVGTKLANLPGHPDYVARKSRIGLLAWPPGANCQCRWCVDRRLAEAVTPVNEVVPVPVVATSTLADLLATKEELPNVHEPSPGGKCPHCDFQARGTTNQQPVRLKLHVKRHEDRRRPASVEA